MEDKFFQYLQKGAHSYLDDSKKRKQVVQNLQPIEYFDLIPLAKEEQSRIKELGDDCKQIFFIRKRKKIPKKTEKKRLNPFMMDLIINKEEAIT